MRGIGAVSLLTILTSCGGSGSLNKLASNASVAAGGLDPALLGTYELYYPEEATAGVIKLLALRTDSTFHAELYVSTCTDGSPCLEALAVEGTYQQTRSLPDLSHATGVSLTGSYADPLAGPAELRMNLKKALLPDSEQPGLYRSSDQSAGPYFEMAQAAALWCESADDCDEQVATGTCSGSYVCQSSMCDCQSAN
jgi:hypothetical protein